MYVGVLICMLECNMYVGVLICMLECNMYVGVLICMYCVPVSFRTNGHVL